MRARHVSLTNNYLIAQFYRMLGLESRLKIVKMLRVPRQNC